MDSIQFSKHQVKPLTTIQHYLKNKFNPPFASSDDLQCSTKQYPSPTSLLTEKIKFFLPSPQNSKILHQKFHFNDVSKPTITNNILKSLPQSNVKRTKQPLEIKTINFPNKKFVRKKVIFGLIVVLQEYFQDPTSFTEVMRHNFLEIAEQLDLPQLRPIISQIRNKTIQQIHQLNSINDLLDPPLDSPLHSLENFKKSNQLYQKESSILQEESKKIESKRSKMTDSNGQGNQEMKTNIYLEEKKMLQQKDFFVSKQDKDQINESPITNHQVSDSRNSPKFIQFDISEQKLGSAQNSELKQNDSSNQLIIQEPGKEVQQFVLESGKVQYVLVEPKKETLDKEQELENRRRSKLLKQSTLQIKPPRQLNKQSTILDPNSNNQYLDPKKIYTSAENHLNKSRRQLDSSQDIASKTQSKKFIEANSQNEVETNSKRNLQKLPTVKIQQSQVSIQLSKSPSNSKNSQNRLTSEDSDSSKDELKKNAPSVQAQKQPAKRVLRKQGSLNLEQKDDENQPLFSKTVQVIPRSATPTQQAKEKSYSQISEKENEEDSPGMTRQKERKNEKKAINPNIKRFSKAAILAIKERFLKASALLQKKTQKIIAAKNSKILNRFEQNRQKKPLSEDIKRKSVQFRLKGPNILHQQPSRILRRMQSKEGNALEQQINGYKNSNTTTDQNNTKRTEVDDFFEQLNRYREEMNLQKFDATKRKSITDKREVINNLINELQGQCIPDVNYQVHLCKKQKKFIQSKDKDRLNSILVKQKQVIQNFDIMVENLPDCKDFVKFIIEPSIRRPLKSNEEIQLKFSQTIRLPRELLIAKGKFATFESDEEDDGQFNGKINSYDNVEDRKRKFQFQSNYMKHMRRIIMGTNNSEVKILIDQMIVKIDRIEIV